MVGIDNVKSAIDDAGANAALNGISNAVFVCGAAEKLLGAVLQVGAVCPVGWQGREANAEFVWGDAVRVFKPIGWVCGLGSTLFSCPTHSQHTSTPPPLLHCRSTRPSISRWWRWWTPLVSGCTRTCCLPC